MLYTTRRDFLIAAGVGVLASFATTKITVKPRKQTQRYLGKTVLEVSQLIHVPKLAGDYKAEQCFIDLYRVQPPTIEVMPTNFLNGPSGYYYIMPGSYTQIWSYYEAYRHLTCSRRMKLPVYALVVNPESNRGRRFIDRNGEGLRVHPPSTLV